MIETTKTSTSLRFFAMLFVTDILRLYHMESSMMIAVVVAENLSPSLQERVKIRNSVIAKSTAS